MINGKWRRSLQDVRFCRGADVNSDHYLLTAIIKLKLRKVAKQSQHRKHLDVAKLKCPNTNRDLGVELIKRFSALADSTEEVSDINSKWETIKKIYVESATKVLGYRKKNKKEWLTPGTWQKIEERKKLKAKMLSIKSPRLLERAQSAYRERRTGK